MYAKIYVVLLHCCTILSVRYTSRSIIIMSRTIVETRERGKQILTVDGSKFTFAKGLKTEETFWRCYIRTCKAKVWTAVPEKLISRSELEHTHSKNTKALNRQIVL